MLAPQDGYYYEGKIHMPGFSERHGLGAVVLAEKVATVVRLDAERLELTLEGGHRHVVLAKWTLYKGNKKVSDWQT